MRTFPLPTTESEVAAYLARTGLRAVPGNEPRLPGGRGALKPQHAGALFDLERVAQRARQPGTIVLELPLPVSNNNLYCTGTNGRRYLTTAARRYRSLVIERYRALYGDQAPLVGPMVATLELYPPDGIWRDLPNMEKLTIDALKRAGAYADDHLIKEWHMYERTRAVPGYIRLTITQRKHP